MLAGFVLLPALTFHLCTGVAIATAEMPATIKVDIERGLLTVDIRNVPLADVLRFIAEEAGFRMIIQGDVSTPVTDVFTDVPLNEGIKRLARHQSFILVYAPSWSRTRGPVLAEVRLFSAQLPEGGRAEPAAQAQTGVDPIQ